MNVMDSSPRAKIPSSEETVAAPAPQGLRRSPAAPHEQRANASLAAMTRVSSSARVVLGNALANVLRGGIAALVALALPPILTRSLPVSTFGAWGLILQLAAYVGNWTSGCRWP